MARNLFAILDDLTGNLAELKAALAPLALIGDTVGARKGSISAKRRTAMREQGRYMSAIRPLSATQRAQVKKVRAAKGPRAAVALARRLAR